MTIYGKTKYSKDLIWLIGKYVWNLYKKGASRMRKTINDSIISLCLTFIELLRSINDFYMLYNEKKGR